MISVTTNTAAKLQIIPDTATNIIQRYSLGYSEILCNFVIGNGGKKIPKIRIHVKARRNNTFGKNPKRNP